MERNQDMIKVACARDCYDTCSLVVEKSRLRIHAGTDPVTRGILCPRAARDPERIMKNRIEHPYLKVKSGFKKICWDDALDMIAESVQRVSDLHDPSEILFLTFAGNTGLASNQLPHRLWNLLGASMTDGGLCNESGKFGLRMHYGSSYGIDPAGLAGKKCVIFWGFNAVKSAVHLWRLACHARKNKKAEIITIDPIRTPTAERSDLWIRPLPGTDVALAYGIINELIRIKAVKQEFIEKFTSGFEELAEAALQWPAKKVAGFCAIDEELVKKAAEIISAKKDLAVMIGIGLQKWRHGCDQVRAASFIPTVIGIHRGFFFTNSDGNFIDDSYLRGEHFRKKSKILSQVGLAGEIRDIKIIYVSCMNPCATLPNQARFQRELKGIKLFVHDTHWSKTAKMADIILPALTFYEKDDVVVPWSHSRIFFTRAAVSPVTEGKRETWVAKRLAQRLRLKSDLLFEDDFEAIRSSLNNALLGGDFDDLLKGRVLELKQKPKDLYQTPSKRIEFFPSAAKSLAVQPLPQQPGMKDNGFLLISSSHELYTHTQFEEVFGPIPATVTINPSDALRLGISEKDEVVLENGQGSFLAKALVNDSVPPGVLWSPKECEDKRGTPQNVLTSSSPQKAGGGPVFNDTRVHIERYAG